MTVREIISKSIELYRNNWKLFLGYTLLTMVVPLALSIIALTLIMSLGLLGVSLGQGAMVGLVALLVFLLIMLVILYIGFLLNIVFTKVVYKRYIGSEVGKLMPLVKESRQVVWKGLWTSIVVGFYASWPLMLAVLGFATVSVVINMASSGLNVYYVIFGLLGLYGVYHLISYTVKLIFAFYDTILYGTKTTDALEFSKDKVKNRWWAMLWRVLIPGLVFYLVLLAYYFLLAAIGSFFADSVLLSGMAGLFSFLGQLIMVPLFMSAIVIVYHNVKTEPAQSETGMPETTPVV